MWGVFLLVLPMAGLVLAGQLGLMYLEAKLPRRVSFHERMERLSQRLTRDSQDADEMLREMNQLTKERSAKLQESEAHIEELRRREGTAKRQLVALEQVQPEAVERFGELLEQGEQRTRVRDYIMLVYGAILTTIVTLLLQLTGVV